MGVDHRGTKLDDDSLSILQLIARHSLDDEQDDDNDQREGENAQDEDDQDEDDENTANGATTSQMEDKTGLASGSIHHRLREKLEPANLIEIVEFEPQSGAAPDRHIWGLTDYGEEWLESLRADDYSPALASEKALEISSEARRHARAARNDIAEAINRRTRLADAIEGTADQLNARLDQQASQIEEAEKLINAVNERVNETADREAVSEHMTDLDRKVNDLQKTANQPNEGFVHEIRDLNAQLTDINRRIDENKGLIVGWADDHNSPGLIGDVQDIGDDLDKAETHIEDFALLAVTVGGVSILALLLALVAVLLASGIL
jgi:DNA-binding PadR family transcriptional regulator